MFLAGERFQPQTSAEWSMPNAPTVEKRYFENNARDSYNFDPIFMGDFKKYDFHIEMTDIDKHNWFLSLDQTVYPRKCIQIVDVESEQPDNVRTEILSSSLDDITFAFYVKRIDGCSDEVANDLLELVDIETQPALPILDQMTQSYDSATQLFTVTMPASMQADPRMLKNIPIDFIFVVGWTIEKESEGLPYMNIVYTVTLASEIEVGFVPVLDNEVGVTNIDKS